MPSRGGGSGDGGLNIGGPRRLGRAPQRIHGPCVRELRLLRTHKVAPHRRRPVCSPYPLFSSHGGGWVLPGAFFWLLPGAYRGRGIIVTGQGGPKSCVETAPDHDDGGPESIAGAGLIEGATKHRVEASAHQQRFVGLDFWTRTVDRLRFVATVAHFARSNNRSTRKPHKCCGSIIRCKWVFAEILPFDPFVLGPLPATSFSAQLLVIATGADVHAFTQPG
jgi:hypothetical protein